MEFQNNKPIYLQVIDDIKSKILSGEIRPGDKLPSSRELAALYEVNPNTASRIYSEMEREGIAYTRRGIGTFVSESAEQFDSIREETVIKETRSYVRKLKALGLSDKEILGLVEAFLKEG